MQLQPWALYSGAAIMASRMVLMAVVIGGARASSVCDPVIDFSSLQEGVVECTNIGCGHYQADGQCYDCTTKTTQSTCGPWGCVWNATSEACVPTAAAEESCYHITASQHLCDTTEGCKWSDAHLICEPCATRNGNNGNDCACHYDTATDLCTWAMPPTSHAPVSLAPTTHAPTTMAPSSFAPVSAAPTTLTPTTHTPTTVAPTTMTPNNGTDSPVTAAPTTHGPITAAPVTVAPTTHTPTTHTPTSHSPVTVAPTTHAPIPNGHVKPAPSTTSSSTNLGTGDISAIVLGSVLAVVLAAAVVMAYRRGSNGYLSARHF